MSKKRTKIAYNGALVTEVEVAITNSVRHYSVQKCTCYFLDNKKENQTISEFSEQQTDSIDILFEKIEARRLCDIASFAQGYFMKRTYNIVMRKLFESTAEE
ncbi:hypothetical protein CIHG_10202 [Coccidioides immitis H538.4]|uniref:Uncharacterized protein n=1 Tax=Coccidioides immitis H538.4 TaxID=396776 RepID=A0A0J8S5Q3_COCIT|nr:hypothetical protein CIHG_10202 [Coccidioides immitis H538.4]